MGLGNYYSQGVLDWLMSNNSAAVPPADWYVALMSVAPTDSGGGTELSGSGYARITLTNNTTNFPGSAVVGGVATKDVGVTLIFGPATADWVTAVAIALYDASSGGNLGPYAMLASPVTVLNTESLTIAATSSTFTQA